MVGAFLGEFVVDSYAVWEYHWLGYDQYLSSVSLSDFASFVQLHQIRLASSLSLTRMSKDTTWSSTLVLSSTSDILVTLR
jgi:hypothetical protein